MAMLRAKVLQSKLRALADGVAYTAKGKARSLTAAERAALEQDCATIRATQIRLGEVSE